MLPGPNEPFDLGYRCDVPAKVVIRVRAVFKQPTLFRVNPRSPDVEDAKGDITTGYIAVTTLRDRKPVAFGSVRDDGKAQVFVAPSRCTQNQP